MDREPQGLPELEEALRLSELSSGWAGAGGGVVVVEEAVFKTGYLGIFPGKGQVT